LARGNHPGLKTVKGEIVAALQSAVSEELNLLKIVEIIPPPHGARDAVGLVNARENRSYGQIGLTI